MNINMDVRIGTRRRVWESVWVHTFPSIVDFSNNFNFSLCILSNSISLFRNLWCEAIIQTHMNNHVTIMWLYLVCVFFHYDELITWSLYQKQVCVCTQDKHICIYTTHGISPNIAIILLAIHNTYIHIQHCKFSLNYCLREAHLKTINFETHLVV